MCPGGGSMACRQGTIPRSRRINKPLDAAVLGCPPPQEKE
jgi:hypothetical protein